MVWVSAPLYIVHRSLCQAGGKEREKAKNSFVLLCKISLYKEKLSTEKPKKCMIGSKES